MENQKLENLLSLSLQVSEAERAKSPALNSGFNNTRNTWELIVKYNGNLKQAENELIQIEELLSGYAIVTLPEVLIEAFSQLNEVEYIEKPKRLFFEQTDGINDSCIYPVRERLSLTGKNILIAIIDNGIDYRNPEFLTPEGTTRIAALWDQTLTPDPAKNLLPPDGFSTGVLFTSDQINLALSAPTPADGYNLVPSRDFSGHGTAVASIAAGTTIGVAPQSQLIVVKLGISAPDSFPRTTQLMRAITFINRYAAARNIPVATNLSFGNVYGDHLGNSLVERFLDNASEVGRNIICIGSGNEAASRGHIGGIITETEQTFEFSVGSFEAALNLQLWKFYGDIAELVIRSPSGETENFRSDISFVGSISFANENLLCQIATPTPYSSLQEIYIDFIPKNTYLSGGIWSISLRGLRIQNGEFHMYLPSASARSADTGFFRSDPYATFTIPSTARRSITVAAYHPIYDSYADFSGRGFSWNNNISRTFFSANANAKPDLCAPGVNVRAALPGGGYAGFTGTSFATPYVTGAAALLMEWGIISGNDPFLYGEKVKAYLLRGAKDIPTDYPKPNPLTGWGALCLQDSIPTT